MKLSKKISVTLLFIFSCLGIIYFYNILLNRTEEGLGNLFWAILAGGGFAYLFGYKAEMPKIEKRDDESNP